MCFLAMAHTWYRMTNLRCFWLPIFLTVCTLQTPIQHTVTWHIVYTVSLTSQTCRGNVDFKSHLSKLYTLTFLKKQHRSLLSIFLDVSFLIIDDAQCSCIYLLLLKHHMEPCGSVLSLLHSSVLLSLIIIHYLFIQGLTERYSIGPQCVRYQIVLKVKLLFIILGPICLFGQDSVCSWTCIGVMHAPYWLAMG